MSAPSHPRSVGPKAKPAEAIDLPPDHGLTAAPAPRRTRRRRVSAHELSESTDALRPELPPVLEAMRIHLAPSAANENRPALWRALPNIGFAPLLWREGLARVKASAAALAAQGLKTGDRVLITAAGDWPVALVAALAAGGEVSLCPSGDPEQTREIGRALKARLALAPASELSALAALQCRSRGALRCIAYESLLDGAPDEDLLPPPRPSETAAWLVVQGAVAAGAARARRKPARTALALSHRAIFALCQKFLRLFELTPADHVLSLLPATAPAMLCAGFFAPLMAGAALHLDPGAPFDARQLTVFRPTVLIATQTQWQGLGARIEAQLSAAGTRGRWARAVALKRHALEMSNRPVPPSTEAKYRLGQQLAIQPLKRLFGLSRVRLAIVVDARGPLDPALVEVFAAIDLPLYSVDGPDAAAGLAFANAPASARFDALGRPFPGLQARLDGAGALWLKGPTLAAEALNADGWLRALGQAEIDFEGFVRTSAGQEV